MKLFPTIYSQDGELMAPPVAERQRTAIPGTPVTRNAGWYHSHADMFTSEARRDRALQAFLEEMRYIPGYMTLKDERFSVTIGSYVRYHYRVMYVIEDLDVAQEIQRRAANGTIPPIKVQEMFQALRRYTPEG